MEIGDILIRLCGDVYPPAEDSILLFDWVTRYSNPGLDLDIDLGSGTGIIGIGNAYSHSRYTILIDISWEALQCSHFNSVSNNVDHLIDLILWNEDMSIFRHDLSLNILMNPPYLPVCNESSQWSGGGTGSDVIIGMLHSLIRRSRFRILFIYSSYTDIDEVKRISDSNRLYFDVIDEIHFPMEKIFLGLICRG